MPHLNVSDREYSTAARRMINYYTLSGIVCVIITITTTRLAVSVWGSMFVFYFILILSILIIPIKYNVEM